MALKQQAAATSWDQHVVLTNRDQRDEEWPAISRLRDFFWPETPSMFWLIRNCIFPVFLFRLFWLSQHKTNAKGGKVPLTRRALQSFGPHQDQRLAKTSALPRTYTTWSSHSGPTFDFVETFDSVKNCQVVAVDWEHICGYFNSLGPSMAIKPPAFFSSLWKTKKNLFSRWIMPV